jgi:hypothetical protein
MTENATEKAWVIASPELLNDMLGHWSQPVQVTASKNRDGSWEIQRLQEAERKLKHRSLGDEQIIDEQGVAIKRLTARIAQLERDSEADRKFIGQVAQQWTPVGLAARKYLAAIESKDG